MDVGNMTAEYLSSCLKSIISALSTPSNINGFNGVGYDNNVLITQQSCSVSSYLNNGNIVNSSQCNNSNNNVLGVEQFLGAVNNTNNAGINRGQSFSMCGGAPLTPTFLQTDNAALIMNNHQPQNHDFNVTPQGGFNFGLNPALNIPSSVSPLDISSQNISPFMSYPYLQPNFLSRSTLPTNLFNPNNLGSGNNNGIGGLGGGGSNVENILHNLNNSGLLKEPFIAAPIPIPIPHNNSHQQNQEQNHQLNLSNISNLIPTPASSICHPSNTLQQTIGGSQLANGGIDMTNFLAFIRSAILTPTILKSHLKYPSLMSQSNQNDGSNNNNRSKETNETPDEDLKPDLWELSTQEIYAPFKRNENLTSSRICSQTFHASCCDVTVLVIHSPNCSMTGGHRDPKTTLDHESSDFSVLNQIFSKCSSASSANTNVNQSAINHQNECDKAKPNSDISIDGTGYVIPSKLLMDQMMGYNFAQNYLQDHQGLTPNHIAQLQNQSNNSNLSRENDLSTGSTVGSKQINPTTIGSLTPSHSSSKMNAKTGSRPTRNNSKKRRPKSKSIGSEGSLKFTAFDNNDNNMDMNDPNKSIMGGSSNASVSPADHNYNKRKYIKWTREKMLEADALIEEAIRRQSGRKKQKTNGIDETNVSEAIDGMNNEDAFTNMLASSGLSELNVRKLAELLKVSQSSLYKYLKLTRPDYPGGPRKSLVDSVPEGCEIRGLRSRTGGVSVISLPGVSNATDNNNSNNRNIDEEIRRHIEDSVNSCATNSANCSLPNSLHSTFMLNAESVYVCGSNDNLISNGNGNGNNAISQTVSNSTISSPCWKDGKSPFTPQPFKNKIKRFEDERERAIKEIIENHRMSILQQSASLHEKSGEPVNLDALQTTLKVTDIIERLPAHLKCSKDSLRRYLRRLNMATRKKRVNALIATNADATKQTHYDIQVMDPNIITAVNNSSNNNNNTNLSHNNTNVLLEKNNSGYFTPLSSHLTNYCDNNNVNNNSTLNSLNTSSRSCDANNNDGHSSTPPTHIGHDEHIQRFFNLQQSNAAMVMDLSGTNHLSHPNINNGMNISHHQFTTHDGENSALIQNFLSANHCEQNHNAHQQHSNSNNTEFLNQPLHGVNMDTNTMYIQKFEFDPSQENHNNINSNANNTHTIINSNHSTLLEQVNNNLQTIGNGSSIMFQHSFSYPNFSVGNNNANNMTYNNLLTSNQNHPEFSISLLTNNNNNNNQLMMNNNNTLILKHENGVNDAYANNSTNTKNMTLLTSTIDATNYMGENHQSFNTQENNSNLSENDLLTFNSNIQRIEANHSVEHKDQLNNVVLVSQQGIKTYPETQSISILDVPPPLNFPQSYIISQMEKDQSNLHFNGNTNNSDNVIEKNYLTTTHVELMNIESLSSNVSHNSTSTNSPKDPNTIVI